MKVIKFLLTIIISVIVTFTERKNIAKIEDIINKCEEILVEKGYNKKAKKYRYHYYKKDIIVHIDKVKSLVMIPIHSKLLNDSIIMISFKKNNSIKENMAALLEASLELYCWTCCLPALQGSRYQQYEGGLRSHAVNQKNSNYLR